MLKTAPVVFAVQDTYQIVVPVDGECLMWVQIGDNTYCDDTNGILRSLSEVHRVTVPMSVLDAAKEYTVYLRPVTLRRGWCSQTEEPIAYVYPFRPVPATGARAYCISDAHGRIDEPVAAAKAFGDIDFLILNGDLANSFDDHDQLLNACLLADRITGGNIPVVSARGNHDLRGKYAEKTALYMPQRDGHTYYTFRFGSVWGLVLDCGEDKRDDHVECGHVFCCRQFRERETAFIRDVIARAEEEYLAEGITTRVMIAHYPFSMKLWPDYNFEEDIFAEWTRLMRESVKPHLWICGHMHVSDVWMPGCPRDTFGQSCPIVLSGTPREGYAGCGYVFGEDKVEATHTDHEGNVLRQTEIPLN